LRTAANADWFVSGDKFGVLRYVQVYHSSDQAPPLTHMIQIVLKLQLDLHP